MTFKRPFPPELVGRILGHLDPMDMASRDTLQRCSAISRFFRRESVRINPLYRTMRVQSPLDLARLQACLLGVLANPLTHFVQEFVLDWADMADPEEGKAVSDVLFQCANATTVDIRCTILWPSSKSVLSNLRLLTMEHVRLEGRTSLVDLLSNFRTLQYLSISDVTYGRLEANSSPLPRSLTQFYFALDEADEDIGPLSDGFLDWMVRNPEKVPAIQHLGIIQVEERTVADVLLFVSILKPSLTSLTITIRPGNLKASNMLSTYLASNDFPIRVFADCEGKLLTELSMNVV